MNRPFVAAGILPAVAGGILPPGWKPTATAAKMAAATGSWPQRAMRESWELPMNRPGWGAHWAGGQGEESYGAEAGSGRLGKSVTPGSLSDLGVPALRNILLCLSLSRRCRTDFHLNSEGKDALPVSKG
jgi:anti-sigma factor RsiW